MSEHSSKLIGAGRTRPKAGQRSVSEWREALQRRWPLYAVLAVLAVVTLAYIDGGEEPLHPITQPVSVPSSMERGQ